MECKKYDLNGSSNAMDAMEKSNFNFIAEQSEMITNTGIDIPKLKAVYRSDNSKVLGVVGKDYSVFQPTEIFGLADYLRTEFGAKYKSSYSVDEGRIIRIAFEPENGDGIIRLPNDDILRKRIFVTGSFDGSTSHNGGYALERALCKNLQIWETKETQAVSVRHTKNAKSKLEEAIRIWNGASKAFEAYERNIRILTEKMVGEKEVEKFLDSIVGKITEETSTRKKNQRQDIEHLFTNGKGNNGKTAWDLYNGVTEYYDHHVNVNKPESALASSMFGSGAKQKSKAFDLALSL